jgi:predicted glycosyltransferase
MPSRPPILFHCQHLLGLGHVQRAARLARALAAAGEEVLFVSGGRPVPGLDLGAATLIPLPPLAAADETISALVDAGGAPPDAAYLAERRTRLLTLLRDRDPGLVLTELFPFGRHGLAFELAPLVLAVADARTRRGPAAPRLAVSLRDVLVSKRNRPWHELAVTAIVLQWVDRILVHGSPDVIPLSRTFELAERLGERLVYTGYLAPAPAAAETPAHGEVVISGGGGQVAAALFHAALAARAHAPTAAARPWRLITGPYLPAAAAEALATRAATVPPLGDRPAVTIETFRGDFPTFLRGAALSVSQAGYNTVLDLVTSRVRAVVVPFEASGDEQPLRARLLAERGLLLVVPERELTPARLGAAMETALARPDFPAPVEIDLDGAARAVTVLSGLLDGVTAARSGTG